MYIDFHTHVFPDKIAEKAVSKLASIIQLKPSTNGTVRDLVRSMDDAGVNMSVILPVVTDPHQFDSILRFASQINEESAGTNRRLLSFAGIHPDCSDLDEKLGLIKNYGFKGIKLHPDYQGCKFNDIRYKRILYRASELDLICSTHTGEDPVSPDFVYCTPEMILDVLEDTAPSKLVLAHMGSNNYLDRAEEMLVGQNVWLDTAYSLSNMDPNQFVRMARKHGTDRILFASDAPWSIQKRNVEIMESLPLNAEEKQAISYGNACRLLGDF